MIHDELLLTAAVDKQLAELSDYDIAPVARAIDASPAGPDALG